MVRIEKLPLRHQFSISFVLILVLSLLTTLALWGAGFLLWRHLPVLPANYWEKKLPAIENYIQQQGAALLAPSRQATLEQVIPGEGIQYQVLDKGGGTFAMVALQSRWWAVGPN